MHIREPLETSVSALPHDDTQMSCPDTTFNFRIPTLEEVVKVINDIKHSGSMVEPWPSTLFSMCTLTNPPDILKLIVSAFSYSQDPTSFKSATVLPIKKKLNLDFEDYSYILQDTGHYCYQSVPTVYRVQQHPSPDAIWVSPP